VADLHIRAMTSPAAAGERFLGTGPFVWMADVAAVLRQELGARASKVPKRIAPNVLIRLIARFDQSLRPVVGELGQVSRYSTEKAQRLLGWTPRPTRDSIVACATSILAQRGEGR
jgi:dihydroflavonol-4-reductase